MSTLTTKDGTEIYYKDWGAGQPVENADFVKTVKGTGRKTLVMAGVWTSVCVVFPAIQATVTGAGGRIVADVTTTHVPAG